jgi:hypothetical protein
MYKLIENQPYVIRIADGEKVLINPANEDGLAYTQWLNGYELVDGLWVKTSECNTPLPADEPENT